MLTPHTKDTLLYSLPFFVILALIGGVLLYNQLQIASLKKDIASLSQELLLTQSTLSSSTQVLSKNYIDLNKQTVGLSDTLSNTKKNIEAVRSQVGGVEQFVGSISNTVGNLQKLSQIDPQLLKKYSKVYFLSDNYVPAHLNVIPSDYTYSANRTEQFLSEGWPALQNLLDQAKRDGVALYVKSSYRSFAEQKSLKSSYSVTYGAGTANAFSADQGYSEHQLGTTIDFTTKGLGGGLYGFDKTDAYEWLNNNAYRYGFILSYPKGNSYYIYEPWHWRFVGIKLATYLHNSNYRFYDMDQREIDKYLMYTFDATQ